MKPPAPPPAEHSRRWLLLSGLALLAAAIHGPHVIPLYDGVGFPDQPYLLTGKPGQPAPQSALQIVPASSLAQKGITLQTPETGPQMKVVFSPGAIFAPQPATQVELAATPQAPSGASSSQIIASNVYRVSAASAFGSPSVKNSYANVYMRLPQKTAFAIPPVIVYRGSGSTWTQLHTDQTGADVYMSTFSGWGEYALAVNTSTAPATKIPDRSGRGIIAAIFIGLILLVVVAIRVRKSGKVQ